MSKNIFATSLRTALLALPFLAGCSNSTPTIVIPPGGLTLPDCSEGQLIAVGQDKTLSCTQTLSANLAAPSCPVNTHALNAVDGNLICMPKGTGTTNTDLQAAIDKLVSQTTTLQMQVTNYGGGGGSAKYCGQTAAFNGLIQTGADTGLLAAAKLCQGVSTCASTNAHMCTPYEMYESVASGVIKQSDTISKSWVYMASWRNSGVTGVNEITSGQADNCGSYTYKTHDRLWYGTAVRWENNAGTFKALKFYTNDGPDDASASQGARCSYMYPIACCK